jgi:hypothetical protein
MNSTNAVSASAAITQGCQKCRLGGDYVIELKLKHTSVV